MASLFDYAQGLASKLERQIRSGDVFAKILSPNDDSGRHGVLVPTDAYGFFPPFEIGDSAQNTTTYFTALDTLTGRVDRLAYKYYQRYPERRITRLSSTINDRAAEPRLIVFLRGEHTDGSIGYYVDYATGAEPDRLNSLFSMVFGDEIAPNPGVFVLRAIGAQAFSADKNLNEFLGRFDQVRQMGWIDSLRTGDTGIGFTFETLLGIQENNDRTADFMGIEIKCTGVREGKAVTGTKINLFQLGPNWASQMSALDRLRLLGKVAHNGRFACHSQVTTSPNNLDLSLEVRNLERQIDLLKSIHPIGFWTFESLERRLLEKHSRAVFVKAGTRHHSGGIQYSYDEVVYCESPDIKRFTQLVEAQRIVFEFLMSEKQSGVVRNHGYPWRLVRAEFLEQLFGLRIKLR